MGLPLGKWLHAYVMSQIRIDTIAFDVRIAWQSVMFSIALTAVFAAIVNNVDVLHCSGASAWRSR